MSLAYDMQAALPALQAQAEARMVDSCTIKTSDRTWVEATASYTETGTVVYSGKCELKSENVRATWTDAQGRLVSLARYLLKLPVVGSENVRAGQSVHIDSSNDPGLVGNVFVVDAFTGGSYMTARRVPISADQ